VPSWLQGSADAAPPAPKPSANADDEPMPAWLQQLRPSEPAPPPGIASFVEDNDEPVIARRGGTGNLPDWLKDFDTEPPVVQLSEVDLDAAGPSDDVPPWLKPATAPLNPPAPAAPAASGDVPSWLQSESAPPAAPAASNDVPSWLQAEASPPVPPAASAGDDVPAWLRGDLDVAPPAALAASGDVPSWLQAESAPPATPAASAGDDVPAWLRGDFDVAPPAAPAASGDVPSWLQAEAAPAAPPVASAGDDVPAWLRGDLDVAPPAAPAASGDVPSWLQAESASPASPVVSAGDDVPAWLRGDLDVAPPAAPAASGDVPSWLQAESAPPVPPAASAGDDVPAWLRGDLDVAPPAAPAASGDIPTWLQADAGALPQVSPTVQLDPEDSDDNVPAWLKADLDVASPAASAASGDIPTWLQADASELPQASPTVRLDPEDSDDNVPAWLKADLDVAPPAAPAASGDIPTWLQADAAPPAPPAASAGDDVPAWLKADLDVAPPAAPAASGDIPAWLQADASELPQASPTVRLDPEDVSDNVPAWLKADLDAAPPAAPAPIDTPNWLHEDAPTVKLDNQAAGIPSWLQEDLPTTKLDSPAGNVPAWLQDDVTPIAPAPSKPEPIAPATPSYDPEGANVPAWLRDDLDIEIPAKTASAAPVIPSSSPSWLLDDEPAQATQDDTLLGSVDLPAWLRQTVKLEEPSPVVEQEAASAVAESADWLRVLGEPEAAIAATSPTTRRLIDADPPALLNRTPERVSAMHLLQELVTKPLPEPAEAPVVVLAPWWQRIGTQRIVASLMMISLLVGLLVPNLLAINTQALTIGGNTSDLYNYVETLNPESRVLIAYEGDLRHNAELGPLEQAISQHLIERKVPMLLLSTDTEGSLLASQRAAQFPIIDPTTGYTGEGAEYLNLGWVKGNELGIAQLGSNLRGAIANLLLNREGADVNLLRIMSKLNSNNQLDRPRITTTKDLDLLIVVADEPGDVQRWMEQFWSREPALPVAILTTNEVLPQIQPYVDVNVNGTPAAIYTAAGLVGEQQYMALRSSATNTNGAITALSLGMITTIVVVLVGGALQLQRRIRGKRNS